MANWEKLNKEFDDALSSMTSEDWELWASKRVKQTKIKMRRIKIVLLTLLFLLAIPLKWLCDISVRVLNYIQNKLADFAYYWSVEFDNRKQ